MSDKKITVLDLLDLDLKGHNSLNLHCIAGRMGLHIREYSFLVAVNLPILKNSTSKAISKQSNSFFPMVFRAQFLRTA